MTQPGMDDDCGGCGTPAELSKRIESVASLVVEGHRALAVLYLSAAGRETVTPEDRLLFKEVSDKHLATAEEFSNIVLPDEES